VSGPAAPEQPEQAERPGLVARVRSQAGGRWTRARQRWDWLDHLVRAYQRFNGTSANHLAAAITYFSFLALFPLLLLGLSIAGYVLAHQPDLQEQLLKSISTNVPGQVGGQLSDAVNTAVDRRGTIGLISLVGVAYAGLGWVGNLRTALQLVWSCEQVKQNPIKAKLGDLLALVGLGLSIVISLALTAGGTAAAGALVRWLGLSGTFGVGTAVRILGIVLAVAADTLVFTWLFVRLPRQPIRYRPVLKGALFTAVGYEILKIVGTVYLARIGNNGVYGQFATFIVLLVWIDLVSRFLLFGAAWTATSTGIPTDNACADGDMHAGGSTVDEPDRAGSAVLGAGAAGAADEDGPGARGDQERRADAVERPARLSGPTLVGVWVLGRGLRRLARRGGGGRGGLRGAGRRSGRDQLAH
jgi:membrane protein